MLRRSAIPLLFLLAATRLGALTLDEYAADKSIWQASREQTEGKLSRLRFVWTSADKDALRATSGGKILGLDAGETLVRFDVKSGLPLRLETSLYNRGDRGEISEKDFNALMAKASAAIDKASGVKAVSYRDDRQSAVRASGSVWDAPNATYKLEWSKNKEDGKRPEFLRLSIFPAGKGKELLRLASDSTAARNAIGEYKPADHLETTPTGDKWIKDVPMVDQGRKGYCAVASTERVMRLYGRTVDEHDIAQLANASGDGGTNPEKLFGAFKANQSKLRVRAQSLMDSDMGFYTALMTDYNGAARKNKKPLIPNARAAAEALHTGGLDPETLVVARKKNSSGVSGFERKIASAIDKGYPVLWGVTLGYVTETPALPQAKGGHMRLIIGYNAKAHTVIYSDSWGKGHERKTMPAGEAFAITSGMMTLVP